MFYALFLPLEETLTFFCIDQDFDNLHPSIVIYAVCALTTPLGPLNQVQGNDVTEKQITSHYQRKTVSEIICTDSCRGEYNSHCNCKQTPKSLFTHRWTLVTLWWRQYVHLKRSFHWGIALSPICPFECICFEMRCNNACSCGVGVVIMTNHSAASGINFNNVDSSRLVIKPLQQYNLRMFRTQSQML